MNLISPAWAADTAAALPPPTAMDTVMQFAPLIAIVALMYFMLIRPQQKRFSDHQKMVKELRRGDKIITGGGVHGVIVKFEGDDVIVVEVADNVRIRLQRGSITAVLKPGETAANANNDPDKSRSA